MKIGNMLFSESPSGFEDARRIHETLAEAELSEALGVDAVWLAEHHFDGNCAYVDPITFASMVLGRTRRIDVGFAVLQTSLYHPVRLAEQLALLDILAEGRLTIGLGRGTNGNIYEYQGYDLAAEDAQARYDEITAFLEKTWQSDGPVTFEGKFWKIRVPAFRPRPVSPAASAFIHGATSEKSMIERARRGQPFLMSPLSYDETARRLSRYRETLAEAGLSDAEVSERLSRCWIWRNVYVAETDEKARWIGGDAIQRMVENRATLRRRTYEEQGLPVHEKDRAGSAAIQGPDQGFLSGSTEIVAQEFQKLKALGIGGVITGFRLGPLSYDAAAESLTLFMEKIAPRLK